MPKTSQGSSTLIDSKPKLSETDIRAYILQQIAEVESVLPKGSQVSIFLKESKRGDRVKTKIVVSTPEGEFTSQVTRKGVFASILGAKEDLVNQLAEGSPLGISEEERDVFVDAIVKGQYLH